SSSPRSRASPPGATTSSPRSTTARGYGSCASTPSSTRPPRSSSSTTLAQRLPFAVEVVQPDNGPEFGSAFHWHVLDKGIGHLRIKPRTPRLNGKVERSHRIDAEEFYRLLEGVVIDDANIFNDKLQEWEDYYDSRFRKPCCPSSRVGG